MIFYEIHGKGNNNLVLLHGWGLNNKVWYGILPYLIKFFRLFLIDLPGFGKNSKYLAKTLEEMTEYIIPVIPKNSIVLGWSLGGLVAIKLALKKPNIVKGLITVSTSPCFCIRDNWPGVKFKILQNFKNQFDQNFAYALEKFFFIQILNTKCKKEYIDRLKNFILSQPFPSSSALENSLNILYVNDLRKSLKLLCMPCLNIYGYLDNLVPIIITKMLVKYWPTSKIIIMYKSYHAPFISHPKDFCNYVIEFNKNLIKQKNY